MIAAGCITSLYDPFSNARVLIGADGVVIPTPATKTAGVNEGIAVAIAGGWAFKCLPHEPISCAEGLVIPPCAYADIDLGSTNFSFNSQVACPALRLDSFNGGRFKHSGRLIYSGTGTVAVMVQPASPDPVHGQKIIQNAKIEFGYLWVTGVNVTQGVIYDVTHGSIMNNKALDWLCINGWDGTANRMAFGVYVTTPPDQNIGFNENIIRVGQMLGFHQIGILVGSAVPQALYIGDNEWDVMLNSSGTPGQTLGAFVDTYASYDEWRISATIYTGLCNWAILFNTGSNHNSYKIRQSTASAGPVYDLGIGNRAI